MIKLISQISCSITLFLVITSCSSAPCVLLINNTGKELYIYFDEVPHVLKDGENIKGAFTTEGMKRIVLSHNEIVFVYDWRFPPDGMRAKNIRMIL